DDALLRKVFGLIALEQRRGQDVFYKMIRNQFTFVLKRLQLVSSSTDNNSKVDRMWERLIEIALFAITATHRKPMEILKGFISKSTTHPKLDRASEKKLRSVFG